MSDPLAPFSPTRDGDDLVLHVCVPSKVEAHSQTLALSFTIVTIFAIGMGMPAGASSLFGATAACCLAVYLWQLLVGKGATQPLRLSPERFQSNDHELRRDDMERVVQQKQALVVHCQSERGRFETRFAFRHSPSEVAALAQVLRKWVDGDDLSIEPMRQADRGIAIAERLEILVPQTTSNGIEVPLTYRQGLPLVTTVCFASAAAIVISASTWGLSALGVCLALLSSGLMYVGWRRSNRRLRIGPDALEVTGGWRLPWDRIRGASVQESRELVVHTLDGDHSLTVSAGAEALAEVIADLADWHEDHAPKGLERLRQGSGIERQHE